MVPRDSLEVNKGREGVVDFHAAVAGLKPGSTCDSIVRLSGVPSGDFNRYHHAISSQP